MNICSLALIQLGAESITSFDDGTKRSNLCRDLYPGIRDAVLRAYPWNCAIDRKELALDGSTPLFGYSYRFALPVDPYCLKVLEVEDDYDFKIEGRYLHSDSSAIKIKYIQRITNPGLFDSLLVEAIIARLASQLAWPITGIQTLGQTMWGLYEAKLREARSQDAMEGTVEIWESNSLIDVR